IGSKVSLAGPLLDKMSRSKGRTAGHAVRPRTGATPIRALASPLSPDTPPGGCAALFFPDHDLGLQAGRSAPSRARSTTANSGGGLPGRGLMARRFVGRSAVVA